MRNEQIDGIFRNILAGISPAVPEAENLRELLQVEHHLRLGRTPWKCADRDCAYFGRPIPNSAGGGCGCRIDCIDAHDDAVRAALDGE